MKIIFLGTSGGIPSKERNLPSIAVHAHEWMLFDCGEGTQRQMMKCKVPYGSINSIFISHSHLDHYLGMMGLLETFRLSLPHKKVNVFLPEGLKLNKQNIEQHLIRSGKIYENKEFEIYVFKTKHLDSSYGFIIQEKDRIKFNEKKAKSLGLKGILFREIQEKGFVKIGKKKIKLKDVSWIKKGKKIVYSGDTAPCKEVEKAAKNADILIHESTFSSENETEAKECLHSTAKDAAKVAKKAKVKQLILTHISPRYKDGKLLLKEAKAIFKNTTISNDGLEVTL